MESQGLCQGRFLGHKKGKRKTENLVNTHGPFWRKGSVNAFIKKHPTEKTCLDLERDQKFGCWVGTGNRTKDFLQKWYSYTYFHCASYWFCQCNGLRLPFLDHKIILNAGTLGYFAIKSNKMKVKIRKTSYLWTERRTINNAYHT